MPYATEATGGPVLDGPSLSIVGFLHEPRSNERLAHRDVVFAGLSFEAADRRHGGEDVCRDCLQHLGAVTLAAMFRGQAQVEQWGAVGEVLQHDETEPALVTDDPVRGVIRIAEAALADPALDVGSCWSPDHVERELVARQEVGQLRAIAPAVVDSDQRDLHCSNIPDGRCHHRPRWTTSSNGRRSGFSAGRSGRSAG